MNWKLFIARRIYKDNEGGKEVSKPAIRIAMAGIAIGLAVMIISVAVVIGFKHQVRDKVIGLSSDILVTSMDEAQAYQTTPVAGGDSVMQVLLKESVVESAGQKGNAKDIVFFRMEKPVTPVAYRWEILGYPLMSALGIRSGDLQNN